MPKTHTVSSRCLIIVQVLPSSRSGKLFIEQQFFDLKKQQQLKSSNLEVLILKLIFFLTIEKLNLK